MKKLPAWQAESSSMFNVVLQRARIPLNKIIDTLTIYSSLLTHLCALFFDSWASKEKKVLHFQVKRKLEAYLQSKNIP